MVSRVMPVIGQCVIVANTAPVCISNISTIFILVSTYSLYRVVLNVYFNLFCLSLSLWTGDSTVGAYTQWDAKQLTACVCDMGYTGNDCTMRMCPKGDDPLTESVDFRTIQISTSTTSGSLTGELKFIFNGQSFSFPAAWTKSACEQAFEELTNIETVTCQVVQSALNPGYENNLDITVNFVKFPNNPYENNIIYNNGNPDLSSFGCDSTAAVGSGKQCVITDISGISFPEYSYCSNRGICDFKSGNCICYESFYGANCGYYAPVAASSDSSAVTSSDVLTLVSTLSTFKASVLRLATTNLGTTEFNMITVVDNYRKIFILDGYGNILMNYGGLTIRLGGASILLGGLKVDSGGLTVMRNGITLTGIMY
jgi:EGF-like domain